MLIERYFLYLLYVYFFIPARQTMIVIYLVIVKWSNGIMVILGIFSEQWARIFLIFNKMVTTSLVLFVDNSSIVFCDN